MFALYDSEQGVLLLLLLSVFGREAQKAGNTCDGGEGVRMVPKKVATIEGGH